MEHYILYISSFKRDYTADELNVMMDGFKENNKRDGITGVIIVGQRNIMQFIQGKEDVLDKTWQKIKTDSRHKNVRVLLIGEIELTLYKDWSLKYISEISGFNKDINYIEGSLLIQNKISNLLRNFYIFN